MCVVFGSQGGCVDKRLGEGVGDVSMRRGERSRSRGRTAATASEQSGAGRDAAALAFPEQCGCRCSCKTGNHGASGVTEAEQLGGSSRSSRGRV